MISIYLENSSIFEIVFIVPSRHEYVCNFEEIGVKRRRCSVSLSNIDAIILNLEEPDD